MAEKPYKFGILIGRFQVLHAGHEMMIEKGLALCEKVGILVGSSQESGTAKNPFSYEMRKKMLHTVFGDQIEVYPLPDAGLGNNSKWGEYVLKHVVDRFGRLPDLLISGKESRRVDWFDGIADVSELYIPKTIDISASRMREAFLADDVAFFRQFSNPKLWECYDEMKKAVLAAKDHTETDSI